MTVPKALTIAGSDSGGGAGIQADLKTFQELDVFGMSAITAVTAQNTLGVQGVHPMPVDFVAQQIESVFADLRPNTVKTGMLFSSEIIEEVARQATRHRVEKLVIDPVMIAKGGAALLRSEAVTALMKELLPLALVVTPNIPEAETMTGSSIRTFEDRKEAAKRIQDHGAAYVIIKGGHDSSSETVTDILYDGTFFTEFPGQRVRTVHSHGTGCTFSAALTAELAKGAEVFMAASKARDFVQAALTDTLGIGGGHGPTNHWAYRKQKGVSE
ncbi:bifunctional hydroxymethylpyrimidine kinase/phosphomethylpyrimidine kinase [Neobacillus mesonae]|nr:bifunctional hydroxymethylpyrimidine kinase/phosphomethylpyrimidine kinase [Neobacillus mesonae]